MFSILFTPPASSLKLRLAKEGVERETFILRGVERETFILGGSQFPLLVPPLISRSFSEEVRGVRF
jgi:hypothetical protein